MKNIEKVLICGIGAVGSIYANKINEYNSTNLRVLVDKTRYDKYLKYPKIFNGKKLELNYVLPESTDYKADLIIIATKYDGLSGAVNNIKNFVKEDTIILSLLNGVTSEETIASKYGWEHVLLSYFIGHSAMREGNNIVFDGIGDIVFGGRYDNQTDKNNIKLVKEYFNKAKITYSIPEDMYRALWLKYMLNVGSNQPSAIFGMTFGQMQENKAFRKLFVNIMKEVQAVAKAAGVNNTETMIDEALCAFDKMIPEGKTSMLQDVEAKRLTEVDMFAGAMIEFGKKYNIPTPYNQVLKEMIETIHESYSK